MPEKETLERAREDEREGKSPSTQAGEFVKEEMDHIREGKHGAASTKQAIAIGLSKARRAGVELPPPKQGKTSEATREKAKRDVRKGRSREEENLSQTFAGGQRGVEARRPSGGFARCLVEASPHVRPDTRQRCAEGGSQESRGSSS